MRFSFFCSNLSCGLISHLLRDINSCQALRFQRASQVIICVLARILVYDSYTSYLTALEVNQYFSKGSVNSNLRDVFLDKSKVD